ncbi:hypothetical protein ABZV93_15730 [Actinopolymorpha sp. NPDC004070]|uniref:hypothetical protein n=1 Tax=Actinopolymorpha sp. NPDC004070 TaxID=3154548 RepID=UPI0033A8662B
MTGPEGPPPAAHIVEAFGGDAARLAKLAGGQGTSWRAGGIALKPTAPDEPIGWLGAVLNQPPDTDDYRVARPVATADRRWIVDGWSATTWVDGAHVAGRWEEALKVSAAFHAALARVEAPPRPAESDPWSVGMRVAWGELPAPSHSRDVNALLTELSALLEQPWQGPPHQLIHGDLEGNIVYADGLPPAVIDFSPHRAPAPFADAIIVADATAWKGAPAELAADFAATRTAGPQLLARAAVYRVITMVELSADPEAVASEIAGYRPVVDAAIAFVTHRFFVDPRYGRE